MTEERCPKCGHDDCTSVAIDGRFIEHADCLRRQVAALRDERAEWNNKLKGRVLVGIHATLSLLITRDREKAIAMLRKVADDVQDLLSTQLSSHFVE